MKNIKKIIKEGGMSLIEILLYFGLLSIVTTAVLSFSIQVLNLSGKSDINNELQSNIEFVMKKITASIHTADGVNDANSIFDNDTGKLALNVPTPVSSPTSYYLSNGAIYLSEGAQTAVKMSSDFISCTQLKFTKVEVNKAPDQIIIDVFCQPLNTEYQGVVSDMSLHTTVNLRK